MKEQELLDEINEMLSWAYQKLAPYSYAKQDDALMLDRIKMWLEHGLL